MTPLLAQVAVTVTATVVKPLYMLLSVLLVLFLRGAPGTDLRLLRLGLLAFFVGESFCAANYLGTGGNSALLELGHGLGMVGMGALLSWGLFDLVDTRVIRLSDPAVPCAAVRLCGRCWKRDAKTCPAHRVLLLAAPLLAVVSCLPLCAPLAPRAEVLDILGTPVLFAWPVDQQILEIRVLPAVAVAAFLVSGLLLLQGRRGLARARAPFFLGVGCLTYALLRLGLCSVFASVPPWADAWEEITELLAMGGLAWVLILLRAPLGLRAFPSGGAPPSREPPSP